MATTNTKSRDFPPAPIKAVPPSCIGIIMDGNRRWAREHGLPQLEGHRRGYEKIKEMLGWVNEAGIRHVIIYAFSTENWNRSHEEVSYLMGLFRLMLIKELPEFKKHGARVRCIGERGKFDKDLQGLMAKAEHETASETGPTLVVALSYGGRAEILNAVNRAIVEGKPVDEQSFGELLWTHGIPDPDLIIRTSGEERLSGFLPWQGVYSELFFQKTYWPAFSREEFFLILDSFAKRKRNFGV